MIITSAAEALWCLPDHFGWPLSVLSAIVYLVFRPILHLPKVGFCAIIGIDGQVEYLGSSLEDIGMYHLSDIKSWFHHVVHPHEFSFSQLKRMVPDKQIWGTLVIIAAVVIFLALLLWLARFAPDSTLSDGALPYRPYPAVP